MLGDWSDNGRIDRVYALPCYEEAIATLPTDIRDYTNASDVIDRAMTTAVRGDPGEPPGGDASPSSVGRRSDGHVRRRAGAAPAPRVARPRARCSSEPARSAASPAAARSAARSAPAVEFTGHGSLTFRAICRKFASEPYRPARLLRCQVRSHAARRSTEREDLMSKTAREETMATANGRGTPGRCESEEIVNTVVEPEASVAPRRLFTIPGRDPFEEVEWELRHAFIPGKDGPAFEQKDVEFPKFWSQTATNIVAQKYFRGRMSSPERERSVKQMIGRIVDTIGGWGREGGYFATDEEADTFEAELKAILVNQYASFNSPVWFNVGFEARPQCSACFILSIEDSMESILDWIRREGVIFRGGSGSGVNLSRLRSSKEQLSKGGYASGPVSFMRGADASAGTIKSGGKTRRAAKMVVLDVDHPDVEEFIWCKAKEERKARVLEAAGYDMTLDSPDWASIQYQNANNSVRVTDAFMESVHREQGVEPDRAHRRLGRRDEATRATCSGRWPRPRGSAPTRESSTTRRSTAGTRSRTRGGSTRPTRARSTCPSTTAPATSRR